MIDGGIKPVWTCGMGPQCVNKETPGEHRGEDVLYINGSFFTRGWRDAGLCSGRLTIEAEPEKSNVLKRKTQ